MDLPKFNDFFFTKLSRLPLYLFTCSCFFNFIFLLYEPLRYCLDDIIIVVKNRYYFVFTHYTTTLLVQNRNGRRITYEY